MGKLVVLILSFSVVFCSEPFKPVPIDGTCADASQCGRNTFCTLSHQCECILGFDDADTIDCQPYTCYIDGDCYLNWGTGTVCISEQCVCAASYKLDPITQTCVTDKKSLGSACKNSAECGWNVLCKDGRCECKLGTGPSQFNNVNCDAYT